MSSYAYLPLKIPLSFSVHQRRPIPIHPSSPFALSIFVNPSLSYPLYHHSPIYSHPFPFPLSNPSILPFLFYLSSFFPFHTILPCHSILLLLSLPPLFLSTPIHLHSFSPIPILPSVFHLPIPLSLSLLPGCLSPHASVIGRIKKSFSVSLSEYQHRVAALIQAHQPF